MLAIPMFMKAGSGATGGPDALAAPPVYVAADEGRESSDCVSGGAVGISHEASPELDAVPGAALGVVPERPGRTIKLP